MLCFVRLYLKSAPTPGKSFLQILCTILKSNKCCWWNYFCFLNKMLQNVKIIYVFTHKSYSTFKHGYFFKFCRAFIICVPGETLPVLVLHLRFFYNILVCLLEYCGSTVFGFCQPGSDYCCKVLWTFVMLKVWVIVLKLWAYCTHHSIFSTRICRNVFLLWISTR